MSTAFDPGRRDFLRSSTLTGGGLVIGFALPAVSRFAEAATLYQPSAYLKIGSDNIVRIVVGYAEMGQGVLTAIPQLIAEELDADWTRIRVEQAPSDPLFKNPIFGVQATGGSTSVRGAWEPMRKAGAAAREMLRKAAAVSWGVDPASCRTENGFVVHATGKRLAYGQLALKASSMGEPAAAALKDVKDFRIVGKPLRRTDTRAKVNGTARFGIDANPPGTLVAVVARSPVIGGKVASFNADRAQRVPGVRHVLQIPSGVAVLATNTWAAKVGREALQIEWDDGENGALSTESIMRSMLERLEKPAALARKDGEVRSASIARRVEALYQVPYLAHACMEPFNCTAWVKPGELEIWAPTQAPGVNQSVLAKIAGIEAGQVKVHTMFLGGGFGRKFAQDVPIEAVQLSKAVDAPVKVVMMREDDTRGQFYRPAAVARFSGGIDEAGRPTLVMVRAACSSVLQAAGRQLPDGIDRSAVEGIKDWPYDCANVQVEWAQYEPGIGVWFWRSVGHSQNAFFVESFVDELAHAAGKDPFAYRLELLAGHPRHKGVLELAAEKARWGKPLPAGRAHGIAVAESFGSYVAQVAEVSVAADGRPRLHRVVAAVDCGQIVNPGIIRRQIESGIIYGLTAALHGKITIKDGAVEQSNFHDYPVVRMSEAPVVEVHIVRSSERPGGVGEPGTPPLAPAVTNAIYALTGKRIRSLPIDPGVLKTA